MMIFLEPSRDVSDSPQADRIRDRSEQEAGGDPELAHHPPEEFSRALAALETPSLIRLRKVMQAFSRPPLLQGPDLLQEAHVRVLSGTRRWPVGIDVMTFLVETMRSIADDAMKKAGRERGLLAVTESGAAPDVVVGMANRQGVMLPVQRTSTAEEVWIGGQDRSEESEQFRKWRQELY